MLKADSNWRTTNDGFGFELDTQSISTYGIGFIIPRENTVADVWFIIQTTLRTCVEEQIMTDLY
jgi:hypothetical protein